MEGKLSRVARSLKSSPIQQLSRLAQRRGAINLAEGFPDFPAPLSIKEAAVYAINADLNQYRESNQLGVRFISTQVSPQLQPRDHRTISPSDPRYEVHPSSFRSELFATMPPKAAPTRNVPTTKVWGYNHLSSSQLYKPHAGNQTFPRWFSVQAQGGDEKHHVDTALAKNNMGSLDVEGKSPKVLSFSPLEGRISGLRNESLKIKRIELSQKLTYALIPALLIVSKTKLTTSMLILAVYWQIYGYFKEIFLDYVHQEVTRKWVLVYFKLLLLILLKDTVLALDLV